MSNYKIIREEIEKIPWVDAGLYSMELALEVAHDLMHRTAESLYPRRDTIPTV